VTVKSLSIPSGGNYVVVAKLRMLDNDPTNGTLASCRISAGGDTDTSATHLTPRDVQTLAFNVVHQFPGAGSVTMACFAGGPYAEVADLKITAIQTGALTNNGV
jgi:hypothetical protein